MQDVSGDTNTSERTTATQVSSGSRVSGGDGLPQRVSSNMSTQEIITILADHRCPDVTADIDQGQCTEIPVAGGGFGDIYQGALKGGIRVAIKCTRLYIQHDDENGRKALKHAAQELYNWSRLKHDNVLELLGLAEHKHRIAMVSPWMENGTLLHYLKRNPLVDRCELLIQISNGLAHLHQYDMVHGDIKSGNILVSGDGVAKLADFGSAVLKRESMSLCFSETNGSLACSIRWAAPEILKEEAQSSKEADIYSLGMASLEVITGSVPYGDTKDMVVMAKVFAKQTPPKPIYFASLNEDQTELLWNLLHRMWLHVPSERPSIKIIQNDLEAIHKHRTGLVPGPGSYYHLRSPSESILPLSDRDCAPNEEDPLSCLETPGGSTTLYLPTISMPDLTLSQDPGNPIDEHDASPSRRDSPQSYQLVSGKPPKQFKVPGMLPIAIHRMMMPRKKVGQSRLERMRSLWSS